VRLLYLRDDGMIWCFGNGEEIAIIHFPRFSPNDEPASGARAQSFHVFFGMVEVRFFRRQGYRTLFES
jgi:hypothetical protein